MAYTNADGLVILTQEDLGKDRRVGRHAIALQRSATFDVDLTEAPLEADVLDLAMIHEVVPAGSVIQNCYIRVVEAAAGGTSVEVGLFPKDGTAADADAVATETTANLVAGAVRMGQGASVAKPAGGLAVASDSVLAVTRTGDFTAGRLIVTVEWFEQDGYTAPRIG